MKSGGNSICSDDSTKLVANCDSYLTHREEIADEIKIQDESSLVVAASLVTDVNYFTDFYTCKFCKLGYYLITAAGTN